MKGVIVVCLKEMIENTYGKEKWKEILIGARVNPNILLLTTMDVDEDIVLNVLSSACKSLNTSIEQLADIFGDYWVNTYAPKLYSSLTNSFKNAKEYLLAMDKIHKTVTDNIPNANPPRFEYESPDDKTLLMTYRSKRSLFPFLLGLIKGVGKHFNETLTLTVLNPNTVKITFNPE